MNGRNRFALLLSGLLVMPAALTLAQNTSKTSDASAPESTTESKVKPGKTTEKESRKAHKTGKKLHKKGMKMEKKGEKTETKAEDKGMKPESANPTK